MSFIDQLLDSARRFERKYAEQFIQRFQLLPWPGVHAELERGWIEPRGWNAVLSREMHSVLTGGSGSGKTMSLAYLALLNARELLAGNSMARVPVFLSARELHLPQLPRITDLPRGLGLSEALAAQCPRLFFPDIFNSGRALVLIDDIDLLPQEQALEWLRQFKDHRVVASARTTLPGWTEFPLPGFRDGDIEQLVNRLPRGGDFFADLKANAVPRSLTANPMTCTMLSQVWHSSQPMPHDRTALFDTYVQLVLGNQDENARTLEGVALAVQRGHPASNEFLPKGSGFLRPAKNRTVEFVHDLWQSYFAARALRLAPDMDGLKPHLQDPQWYDTILFYAGLGNADDLADALLMREQPYWAGRVVAHAAQVRPELRERLLQDMIRRAWEGDEQAMAVLSEMNSDVAVDGFAAKLKDKDPTVRTRAAEILGRLQLDRGIEYLLPQLRDVNGDVRDKVVEALGHSRTDRVIEPLLVALRGDPRVGQVDTRLRVAAAKALGEVASDKALTALVVDLQIGEPEVRPVAAEALKRITSPLMRKPLLDVLQSGDEAARAYAAQVLAVVDGKG